MSKLPRISVLALFILGLAPQARSADVMRFGIAPARAATAGAFINRYYPGWGPAMSRLVRSPEGRIMARFESDFGLGGREDSPLLAYVDVLGRKGYSPEKVRQLDAAGRDSAAREFLRIFVGRQAGALAARSKDSKLSLEALAELKAEMELLSRAYGLSMPEAESPAFKMFGSAYRAVSKRLERRRLGSVHGIARGADAWQTSYSNEWALRKTGGLDRPSLKLWVSERKISTEKGRGAVSLRVGFKHNSGAVLFKVPAAGAAAKPEVVFVRGSEPGPYASKAYEVTSRNAVRIAKLVRLLQDAAAKSDKSLLKDKNVGMAAEALEAQAQEPSAIAPAWPTPKYIALALGLLAGAAAHASAAGFASGVAASIFLAIFMAAPVLALVAALVAGGNPLKSGFNAARVVIAGVAAPVLISYLNGRLGMHSDLLMSSLGLGGIYWGVTSEMTAVRLILGRISKDSSFWVRLAAAGILGLAGLALAGYGLVASLLSFMSGC